MCVNKDGSQHPGLCQPCLATKPMDVPAVSGDVTEILKENPFRGKSQLPKSVDRGRVKEWQGSVDTGAFRFSISLLLSLPPHFSIPPPKSYSKIHSEHPTSEIRRRQLSAILQPQEPHVMPSSPQSPKIGSTPEKTRPACDDNASAAHSEEGGQVFTDDERDSCDTEHTEEDEAEDAEGRHGGHVCRSSDYRS